MRGRRFSEFRLARHSEGLRKQALGWIEAIVASQGEDPALWIHAISEAALLERISELEGQSPQDLPLYGLPFAVKDNIDVRGFPTTAACPAFSYQPEEDAPVVAALLRAGAICLGKTNLDQFATGLVGTRSPYGVPINPIHPEVIPGGSSSGSAVAVARGLVAFSLGTDTAGSGRVPAALCGIVGWKPSRGLLSTRGVVPACRSLDCVSIFAAAAADIAEVAPIVSDYDASDPWSRVGECLAAKPLRKIGIPLAEEMQFFGDAWQQKAWEEAVKEIQDRGNEVLEVSFAAFFEAARLLYEGPWVAERYLAVRELLEKQPEALLPITRKIIAHGRESSASDAFAAQYRLAELACQTRLVWETVDAICLPTVGAVYRRDEVEKEPLERNTDLGYYTNFFNLLDLCGVALPFGQRGDGLPFGITLAAPAWNDASLFGFEQVRFDAAPTRREQGMRLAVFGAHMRGLPLESRLLALGGRFLSENRTASLYRMVALDALRPGVFQVQEQGASLDLEIWELPISSLGTLLAEIPAPLGLGRVWLETGEDVCGFLCEFAETLGKRDITEFRGWRQALRLME